MCGWKVGLGDTTCGLVGIEGGSGRFLPCLSGLEFREVTVVVSLHFVIEHLGLLGRRVRDQALVDDVEDVVTDVDELGLDLRLVVFDDLHLVAVALLLDAGNDAPRGSAGSDHVLVRDGQEVTFLDGQFLGLLGDLLHIGNHFIETFGLLSELGCCCSDCSGSRRKGINDDTITEGQFGMDDDTRGKNQ